MTGPTQPKRPSCRGSVALNAVAVLSLAGLAGCSSFGGKLNTYTCPTAITVPELQTLVTVVPGASGAAIQSSGRINSVSASCDREGDTGIVSTVTVEFAGLRTTPAVPRLALPYFVAVANASGTILGKQQYTMVIDFDPNAPVAKAADSVTVHLPLKNPQLGNIYSLVIGFQLNQSQLDYNRAHLQ